MNAFKRYTKILFCSAGLLAAALVAGCGGGGDQGRDPILGLPGASLVSIAVTPATASIALGTSQQFVATAVYSDGSAQDVSTKSAWTTATPAVATVTAASGNATGLSQGSAAISATFNGKTGTAVLTVAPAALMSLQITPAAVTLFAGETRQLTATATYSDGTAVDVTTQSQFTSANTAAVSTTTPGLLRGVAEGSSIISAAFGGKIANSTATTAAATLSSISISPASATVNLGATQTYVVTARYSDNSTAIVTSSAALSSSVTGVATILNTGVATGVSVGTTTITANLNGQTANASMNVVAVVLPEPTPNPEPPVLAGVNLGSAANFAVLAGTSITNNAGGTTLITGNVGAPSQTTDPTLAAGFTNYKSGAILAQAMSDLQVAISDANSRTCTVSSASGVNLGGLTLTPGVYCYAGAISLTGTLKLNGPGVYIFRTAMTLNTAANSIVELTNGATAGNLTWVPVGPTTLGANSVFKGSILGQAAAITVGDNTTLLNGRVLTAAAVTLSNNQITK
ncbi:ice-binding family protein [Massilia soli]|uniref:Ice-binding family protein n=1 Tax=Massilia soli TaxID=2792854 RepID=A0ABS7SVY6_9BURK|nr:ice-binding family protein [Massilia soli]MBZ2210108.1 ice-binding family protein [Massilia soli]